jgi:hypothetical protein
MLIGVSRRLESRERDWRSLVSLAEKRKSSATRTTLAAYSARSLAGYASSRMRKYKFSVDSDEVVDFD